ncbi:MAG: acetylxylan esterase [Ruminococcaceae bacterium]|nr:acetylxylan esterase [Oscillospiraceae bacterium]
MKKTRIFSFFLAIMMIITSMPLFFVQSGASESPQAAEAYDYDALYAEGALIKYDFYDFIDDGTTLTADDGYGSVTGDVYKRDRHVRFYKAGEKENGNTYTLSYMNPTEPVLTASQGKTYTFQFVVKSLSGSGYLYVPQSRIELKRDAEGYVDMSEALQLLQKNGALVKAESFTNESGALSSGVKPGETYHATVFGKYDSVSGGVDANVNNPYVGDGAVKAAVMIGDMKKSFEYSYTKDNPISTGYVAVGGAGQSGEFYAYRVYDRELTEAEIKQNHFADLAKFYRFEPSDIEKLFDLPEYLFDAAYENTLELKVDAAVSVAGGQAAFKKIVDDAWIVFRDSYYVTDGLVFRADFFDAKASDKLSAETGVESDYDKFIKYRANSDMSITGGNSSVSLFNNASFSVGYNKVIGINNIKASDGSELSDMSFQYVYSNTGSYNSIRWCMPLSFMNVYTTTTGVGFENEPSLSAFQNLAYVKNTAIVVPFTDVTDFTLWFDRTVGDAGTGAGRARLGAIINGTAFPDSYFSGDADGTADGSYTLISGKGNNITFGATGSANLYAVRIYDKAITADDVNKNHISDMLNYYEFSVDAFFSLSDEQKAWVISEIAKLNFESFKIADTFPAAPDKEAANTYFENLVKWAKLDFAPPAEFADEIVEELEPLTASLTWENYKDEADPAAKAQEDFGKLLDKAAENALIKLRNSYYVTDGLVFRADFFDAKASDVLSAEAGVESDYEKFIKYRANNEMSITGGKLFVSAFNNGSFSIGDNKVITFNNIKAGNGSELSDMSFQYVYSNTTKNYVQWYTPLSRMNVYTSPSGVGFENAPTVSALQLADLVRVTETVIDKTAVTDFVLYFDRTEGNAGASVGRAKVGGIINSTKIPDAYFPGDDADGAYTLMGGKGNGISLGTAGTVNLYAARIYDRVITADEAMLNHISDMLNYYDFSVLSFFSLTDEQKKWVISEISKLNFESFTIADVYPASPDKAAANTYFENLVAQSEIELPEAPELTELVDFLGYSTRINSYPGIRAQFTMNEENLAALEEQGYNVEVGVIMAISDGKKYSDLTVYNNEGIYVTSAGKALNKVVYKTGEGENGYIANYFTEDGKTNFVYAIVYEKEATQTAEYYATDCMYRAYAIAKKEGRADIVTYFDCKSDLFGEDVSIYELTAYHAYEEGTKATDDTFLDVIEKAGYTTDIKDAIALLNDCNTKFAAGEEITFGDLNKLYNYQLKANKDSYFREQMKYYEPNDGTLTLEKGSNDDLYELINTFWGIYNTKLGVDIRDSLYEIGTGSVEVYFEDISDTVEGNKKAYEYKTGDDVVFKLALRQKGTNILFPCTSFTYKYRIDGVVDENGRAVEYTGTQTDDDGIFELTIPASEIAKSTTLTANKGAVIELLVNATSDEATILCEGGATNKGYAGGAVVNFDSIKATQTKPEGYDAFWAEQIAILKSVDPTDSTVPTEDTRYSATSHPDILIYDDIDLTNYFHIKKFDAALLATYKANGISSLDASVLDSYDIYEVSLKAPGPNPTTGILSIPKGKTDLTVSFSYDGYGVSAPSIELDSDAICFHVTHHGYKSGQARAYYTNLFENVIGPYGQSSDGQKNSTYTNKDDCYILYMFLRNLQAVRFISECKTVNTSTLSADAQELYSKLAVAYGEKITLTGGSMGGYQALGVAALAAKAGYEIEQASVSVPAFCNTSGYKKEGRINNIFGIGYEANMDYFDGVFFAEYIECKTAFTKVGLGDYTCPPSGVIAAYNALKCDKSMNLHQNSQHDYWSDANPIYTFSEYAETE